MSLLLYGTAGWVYEDWKGVVYPRGQGRGFDPLRYLTRFVNLLEVNASFYAPLPGRVAEAWVRRLQERPDVRFVIKAWRRFTHEHGPLPPPGEIACWKEVLAPLVEAGRLVAVLMQFPFSFQDGTNNRSRILALRDQLDGLPVATEFRHACWMRPQSLAFLEREGLAFVNIDQPRGPGQLPPTAIVTGALAYTRLHGRNAGAWFQAGSGRDARYNYLYPPDEIKEWVARLEELQGAATTASLLVGNNHFQGKALVAVLQLASALKQHKLPVPEPLLEVYPELERIQEPTEGRLF